MTKLTDIQAILLSTAAGREEGSLLPMPGSLAGKDEQVRKAIEQLIKRGLAAEAEVTDRSITSREEGDRRFAALITDAGKHAIGVMEPDAAQQSPPPVRGEPRCDTKQAKVLDLLQREQGASVADIVEATGWLPHTTRAALTGIRKRGTTLDKTKVDGVTRYKAVVA